MAAALTAADWEELLDSGPWEEDLVRPHYPRSTAAAAAAAASFAGSGSAAESKFASALRTVPRAPKNLPLPENTIFVITSEGKGASEMYGKKCSLLPTLKYIADCMHRDPDDDALMPPIYLMVPKQQVDDYETMLSLHGMAEDVQVLGLSKKSACESETMRTATKDLISRDIVEKGTPVVFIADNITGVVGLVDDDEGEYRTAPLHVSLMALADKIFRLMFDHGRILGGVSRTPEALSNMVTDAPISAGMYCMYAGSLQGAALTGKTNGASYEAMLGVMGRERGMVCLESIGLVRARQKFEDALGMRQTLEAFPMYFADASLRPKCPTKNLYHGLPNFETVGIGEFGELDATAGAVTDTDDDDMEED